MKKTKLILLLVAIAFIVGGGLSTAFLFSREQSSAYLTSEQTHELKTKSAKKLTIQIKADTQVKIQQSETNKLSMTATDTSKKINWTVEEASQEIVATVSQSGNAPRFFSVSPDLVTISVPKQFSEVVVNSGVNPTKPSYLQNSTFSLIVTNMNCESLSISDSYGDISALNSSIDNLSLKSQSGTISIENVQAKSMITLKTDHGDIEAMKSSGKSMIALNQNGEINFEDISASSVKGTNKNGDIQFHNVTGSLNLSNQNGDVEVSGKKLDSDISAESSNGDIKISSTIFPNNLELSATNKWGDISILGKDTKSIKRGTGSIKWNFSNNSGDIDVEEE